MKLKKLDAFLVPRADMFSGEEVPGDEERLKYISNFSGSAGYAIISASSEVKSVILSDGRYELQLKKEVDPQNFDCLIGGFKDICLFLKKNEKKLKNIAIDPWLLTLKQYELLNSFLKNIFESWCPPWKQFTLPSILKPDKKKSPDKSNIL